MMSAERQLATKAMPVSDANTPRFGVLQRKCACGSAAGMEGECEECKQKEMSLQRRANGSAAAAPPAVPPIVHDVLRSPGRPLDASTRAYMEPRFGHDFSNVRVHADDRAAESARAVNALAYTVGEHIVFGSRRFEPRDATGSRLLAHELSHTIQQGGATSFTADLRITDSDGPLEHEAERAASATQMGQAIPALSSAEQNLSRETPTPAPAPAVFRPSPPPPTSPPAHVSNAELAEAGLVALARVLDGIGKSVEPFRALYNRGEAEIAATRAKMLAAGKPEAEIAKTLAGMRKQLALDVREASGAVQKRAAELFDLVRGNVERPGYESLRAAGKTDADIIRSATRTNEFVNRLPSGLRWTGRAMVLVQGGISIYVVVEAKPEERPQVAAQEAGGFFGGIAGAEIAEGLCIVVGIATEGAGLIVCGIIGGIAGFEAGHAGGPVLLQAEIEREKRLEQRRKECDQLSGVQKSLCLVGAQGRFEP